jgi:hypothetical protein
MIFILFQNVKLQFSLSTPPLSSSRWRRHNSDKKDEVQEAPVTTYARHYGKESHLAWTRDPEKYSAGDLQDFCHIEGSGL